MTRREFATVGAAVAAIAAMLLVYSQTRGFGWDEGFHLLAARLIDAGKRPYADFIFAQTPLNAWWNALLMRLTGYGWRGPHAGAALESAGAVWLVADFVLRRAPVGARVWLAIAAAASIGLNQVAVNYATMSQAYGLCMLLGVAAFRLCLEGRAFLAGVAAGAAASASLLTAPLGLTLFVWLAFRNARKAAAFVLGALVGLSPILWYLAIAPKQLWFEVVGFHLYYRQVDWSGWFLHDLEVLTGWLDSGQGMLTIMLAGAGIVLGRKRREIVLCSWIAIAYTLYLSATHPTFAQYFTVALPFSAILAAACLQELDERRPQRWPAYVVTGLMAAMMGRTLWQQAANMSWANLETVAAEVRRALRPGDTLYADEHIYVLTGVMPPAGMEWGSSHKIAMPLDQAHLYHVLPQAELDILVKRGGFAVAESCDEDEVKRLGLADLYKQSKQIGDCFVFHELKAR